METNIDHLHDVIEGRTGGRNCGKTFAKCHLIAGYIETGIERIYIKITNRSQIGFMINMLGSVLKEHDLPFAVEIMNKTARSGDTVIRFILENDTNRNIELMRGSNGIIVEDLIR